MEYLTELFFAGKSYSVLNTARSALSAILIKDSGLTIGNSPLIKRFMKGVFELKPPVPRYKFIWDVNIVLNFLSNYYPNENLSLSVITYKCAMLLALSSLQRVQTLAAININDIYFCNKSVLIPIKKKLKQFRINRNSFTMRLKYFLNNPAVCPCETLKQYLCKTKALRQSNQLFISYQKPYLKVSTSTISRWIKTVLYEAGIDVTLFKSHSTRTAAASAVFDSQIEVNDILQTAGWSNAKTFKMYYNKIVL